MTHYKDSLESYGTAYEGLDRYAEGRCHNRPTLGTYFQGMGYRALQALIRWGESLEIDRIVYESLKGYPKGKFHSWPTLRK